MSETLLQTLDRTIAENKELREKVDELNRQVVALGVIALEATPFTRRIADLESQLAELRSQPTDIVQRLNAALGEAFKDDPANAVRAHAAVLPLLLSQQTAQQVEDARKVMLSALVNCAHSISENCVVLHRDKSKPGNALNQLVTRAMQAGKEKVE